MIGIRINGKEYEVEEAKTSSEKAEGLSNREQLDKDKGMIFYFDPPQDVSFWMKDTKIPLDIIFVNDEYEVIKVQEGIPDDETPITAKNVSFVIELNKNSNVKKGDDVEIEDRNYPLMKVLFQDGTEQYALWGGERIFRRVFTKQLINLVKNAERCKDDPNKYRSYCKRIGAKMFKEIHSQDERSPEFVDN